MRIYKILFVFTLLVLCFTFLTAQKNASRTDLENRRSAIMREISATQQLLSVTKKEKAASMGQLRALQAKLNAREKLIHNIDLEMTQINKDIAFNTKNISDLTQKINLLKASYARSVRYAYKNQNAQSMLAFLLSAENFNDAMRRYQYMKKSRDFRLFQAGKLRGAQSKLQHNVQVLSQNKNDKTQLKSVEQSQQSQILAEKAETDIMIAELKAKEGDLSSQIAKKRRDAAQLESTIKSIIKKEIEIARAKAAEEERQRLLEEKKKAEAQELARKKAEEQQRQAELAKKKAELDAMAARKIEEDRKAAYQNKKNNDDPSTNATLPKTVVEREKQQANNSQNNDNAPVANKSKSSTPENTYAANKPTPAKPPVQSEPPAEKPSYKMSLTPEVKTISNNFAANRGRLPWPVTSGYIAIPYGTYKHPLEPKVTLQNSGIDIATNAAAPVRAVYEGTVSRVVKIAGSYTVIVNHGEYFTVYSYLSAASVSAGQRISSKQTIGTAGTNDDGESMVHFEICRVGGNNSISNENPASWISR